MGSTLRGRAGVAFVVALLMSSCGRTASSNEAGGRLLVDHRVVVDGTERVFDLYVPASGPQDHAPMAAVVLLHGQRASRADLEGESRKISPYALWQPVADANNVMLLIPQGLNGSNGHPGWNDCRTDADGNPEADDVAFITAALDEVASSYSVDPERLFAVGTSNGGHMAIRLAQQVPDRIAGIGVIAAGMPANSRCDDSSVPVPAVFVWGTADPIAPYAGGAMASSRGEIFSAEQSVQYWIDRNGASPTPEVTTFADSNPDDGSTVERLTYPGPAPVALYRVDGGAHTEPSIEAHYRRAFLRLVGAQNHDIEMATQVWEFFAAA